MPLPIYGLKRGSMERPIRCIWNVVMANLVHLVYRNRSGGEPRVQDALIVPSLGY